MDRLGQIGLAVEQGGAVERREQPLVGIDDERVGLFESRELVPDRGGEQRGSAVGAVDVEPQIALVRHLGHAGEIVDDAGVGRPGRGDDADDVVGPRMLRQHIAQARAGQAVILGGDDERLDADDVERLADRGVGLVADRDQGVGRPGPATPVSRQYPGPRRVRRDCPPSRRPRSTLLLRRAGPPCAR